MNFIIYTTKQGGIMKVIRGDRELYEKMKDTREFQEQDYTDDPPPPVKLYMVAFAEAEEVWDFRLGRAR